MPLFSVGSLRLAIHQELVLAVLLTGQNHERFVEDQVMVMLAVSKIDYY